MFTDTVGYTASTQVDEARTLEVLHSQQKLVRPLLVAHRGREVKSTGDGFLVEFDSALMATQCAIDIQRRIYERNAEGGLPPIRIRIGIHLGDVVQSDADILGDAVNIAARIEPVAEPGGICLSSAVREQVWNKIPDKLEKLPPTALKGLQASMDLYRVVLPWTLRGALPGSSAMTGIAVLPFTNISPDPKDEYFADGLTEELITVLSQLPDLRVIARTSVMQFKSSTKAVSLIASELGVSSVLEGSVRKAGNRLRITVQLIDPGSQGHVWAQTYDRELDDVFAVQAEIAKQVAEALKIQLRATEAARLATRLPVRPDSYLAYLKGRTLLHSFATTSLEGAKQQFELAITLDPTNAAAHSGLADAARLLGWYFPRVSGERWDATSRGHAARAIELDPNLAEAHASLAIILWDDNEYVAAEKELKLALSLNPSYSPAHDWYAGLLEDEARVDEALRERDMAEAADPLWGRNLSHFALLLIWLGRFDDALVKLRKLGEIEPDGISYHVALASYHLARSDLPRSLEETQRIEELQTEPRWKPVIHALRHALRGEKEEARTLLKKEETLPAFHPSDPLLLWAYVELGDLDDCFRLLAESVRGHQIPLQQVRLDPRYEGLRKDSRFQVLLKKMNLA